MNRLLFFAAILLIFFAGCDKNDDAVQDITLSDNELEFEYYGYHSQTITVASANAWKASVEEGADWVTVDPVVGIQQTNVTVYVAANSFYESRSAVVTFATGKSRETVKIIQTGAPKPEITSISISPSSATVYRGYTQQFSVSVESTNNPPHTVIWSLLGNLSTSTTISNSGLLKVAENETATSLTVRVTSTFDTDKYDAADVSVADAPPIEAGVEINGIRWATRNVDVPGTFAATPESPGMFYQWNRKVGWSSTDPLINSNGGTTWDKTDPSGTKWEKANDPCPFGYRVPTLTELQRLLSSGSSWTTQNGVNGRIFGSGSNTLFLPAAGYRYYSNGLLYYAGAYGIYWSSTQDDSNFAYSLYFDRGYAGSSRYYRSRGFSVRCVQE